MMYNIRDYGILYILYLIYNNIQRFTRYIIIFFIPFLENDLLSRNWSRFSMAQAHIYQAFFTNGWWRTRYVCGREDVQEGRFYINIYYNLILELIQFNPGRDLWFQNQIKFRLYIIYIFHKQNNPKNQYPIILLIVKNLL